MNFSRWALLFLLLSLIAGNCVQAKDSPKDILERLPQTIADYPKGELHDYGRPGLGYSVAYNARGVTITAYVYDLGHATVADGLTDPAIREAFEMAKREVKIYEERGTYSDVRLLSEGKESTLSAQYELTRKDMDGLRIFSETHIFGAWNQIIKLRISGPLDARVTEGPKVKKFVADFVKAIQLLPPAKP